MENARFDALARRVASTSSRRALLKSAVSMAVGGSLGVLTQGKAGASGRAPGEICRKNGDCASGACGPADRTGRRRCQCASAAECPQPAAGDQCRTAVCTAGVCGMSVSVGKTCDDGNRCTTGDVCTASGACAGTSITCTTPNACYETSVCDPATGQCTQTPKPDGAPCEDGDLCTLGDTCQSGVCVAGPAVTCSPLSNCHDAGVCNPATGQCTNPAKPDGTGCSDQNACTQTDTCQAGVCTGANPVVCAPQTQCQEAGTCNQQTGVCDYQNKPDGTPCDDGDACTTNDTCQGGVCVAGTATTCPAPSSPCLRAGTCNPATGECSDPVPQDGVPCDDGNPCTTEDICLDGQCVGRTNVADGTTCPEIYTWGVCESGDCCIAVPNVSRDGVTGFGVATCSSVDQCCQDETTLCQLHPFFSQSRCCHPRGGTCDPFAEDHRSDCCLENGTQLPCIGGICGGSA